MWSRRGWSNGPSFCRAQEEEALPPSAPEDMTLKSVPCTACTCVSLLLPLLAPIGRKPTTYCVHKTHARRSTPTHTCEEAACDVNARVEERWDPLGQAANRSVGEATECHGCLVSTACAVLDGADQTLRRVSPNQEGNGYVSVELRIVLDLELDASWIHQGGYSVRAKIKD